MDKGRDRSDPSKTSCPASPFQRCFFHAFTQKQRSHVCPSSGDQLCFVVVCLVSLVSRNSPAILSFARSFSLCISVVLSLWSFFEQINISAKVDLFLSQINPFCLFSAQLVVAPYIPLRCHLYHLCHSVMFSSFVLVLSFVRHVPCLC